ncbi:N-acetylmuramic acid 6-phosphate etherase [Propioniferax innocua]|uniref:N-acetylmuramic acid 6-phosphate etherase n=1 Tax=Propioniferax innocua TaxID=1753 RepID=A0A542Z8G3_9ACTN|nr:N-acetylmuramic acid 6-phosphate etherase [Propioniferax innocua]TQL56595.1 N-acetylmuramic acid 6-phosphate etherase [Propioniferax innocua]
MTSASAVGTTERRNPATQNLDRLPLPALLRTMNDEDHRVPNAVAAALPAIADATELIVDSLRTGGRLIYTGAGTSGRLGVLDAAECVPTFGTSPEQVVGLIAGGPEAMFRAIEGAEDSPTQGAQDLADIDVDQRDTVVGIAASGRTPYVLGALEHARSVGASTVAVSCNPDSAIGRLAQIAIEVDNGPEVLTGSTRMKAGTSQKIILNMLSTAAMVRLGKVYGNLMVDVVPTNAKLRERAVRIVTEATQCSDADARAALEASDNHAKTAIVMLLCNVDADTARQRLAAADGFVGQAAATPMNPDGPEGTQS